MLHHKFAPLIAGLLLGACGGGSDKAPPEPPVSSPAQVPDSALVSAAAYTQFTLGLSQSAGEAAEPLGADRVDTPPGSETDEPAPLG